MFSEEKISRMKLATSKDCPKNKIRIRMDRNWVKPGLYTLLCLVMDLFLFKSGFNEIRMKQSIEL